MGDFFNEVVSFLEEYYVYAIGVGAIIILMLIGLLASRRKSSKNQKTEGTMTNINDVNTGTINDVVNTLQNNSMQPVDVVTFPGGGPSMDSPEQPAVDSTMDQNQAPVMPEANQAPVNEGIASEPMDSFASPVEPVTPTTDNFDLSTPFGDIKPTIQEPAPADDDRFEKTEVIDLGMNNVEQPVSIDNNSFTPYVADKSQTAEPTDILNGETTRIETPRE